MAVTFPLVALLLDVPAGPRAAIPPSFTSPGEAPLFSLATGRGSHVSHPVTRAQSHRGGPNASFQNVLISYCEHAAKFPLASGSPCSIPSFENCRSSGRRLPVLFWPVASGGVRSASAPVDRMALASDHIAVVGFRWAGAERADRYTYPDDRHRLCFVCWGAEHVEHHLRCWRATVVACSTIAATTWLNEHWQNWHQPVPPRH